MWLETCQGRLRGPCCPHRVSASQDLVGIGTFQVEGTALVKVWRPEGGQ